MILNSNDVEFKFEKDTIKIFNKGLKSAENQKLIIDEIDKISLNISFNIVYCCSFLFKTAQDSRYSL